MDMSDLMRFFEWFMEATVSHVTQLRTDVSDFKDKIIEVSSVSDLLVIPCKYTQYTQDELT